MFQFKPVFLGACASLMLLAACSSEPSPLLDVPRDDVPATVNYEQTKAELDATAQRVKAHRATEAAKFESTE